MWGETLVVDEDVHRGGTLLASILGVRDGGSMKSTFLVVCCAAIAIGCTPAEWATDSNGLRAKRNMCGLAASSDAIVLGTISSAELIPREMVFSWWPGYRLKTTGLRVDVVRDLKGTLEVESSVFAVVSAPVSPARDSVMTYHPTPLRTRVWIPLARVDSSWLLGSSGVVMNTGADSGRYETDLGSFESESAFEVEFERAVRLCPRIDFFGDGGIPDGGYAEWEAEYTRQRELMYADAGLPDGGK